MIITFEDVCRLEAMALKANEKELIAKIIEIKDYMRFHNYKELEFAVDWRKDREEESNGSN